MPLHDHFHPPWSVQRPWEGFHSAWATSIAFHLNSGVLPEEYFAMPLLQVGGRVEVDVGAFEGGGPGGLATTVWAPPKATLSFDLEVAEVDAFEVRVHRNLGGPQLRAAIELVSPANKDRPASRHVFAAKCAGYLRGGVSVIVVDAVTERAADLHAEILRALDRIEAGPSWSSATRLFAASYRAVLGADPPRLEAWPEALAIGAPLPTLPLWLEADLSVPLSLEEGYAATCASLRMRG